MILVAASGILLLVSGFISLILFKNQRLSNVVGAVGALAGTIAAIIPAIDVLSGGTLQPLKYYWSIPLGSFNIGMDRLSAWFVMVICVVCAIAAIYGLQYLQHYIGKKHLGSIWFFYNLLVAGMLFVVVSRNGMLFLISWEIMSLASFFLVVVEDEKPEVRQAGYIYLIATHIGTAFLILFFLLMSQGTGSMDFDSFASFSNSSTTILNVAFLFALLGFGTKAGFLVLHVWLPEAHPVAPSHVSAVMSGVMIKTGIYGLLRTLTLLGEGQTWWAWVFIGIGAASGIVGILFSLSQRDLKRLLAYSSVENIGIIALGIGIGLFGLNIGQPLVAVLGFSGALLHVANHALFKSLLFLGAGAVRHATGTLEVERLGGLLKRMPATGASFITGAAAVSGLPPLNGFVSELLIYLAAFQALLLPETAGLPIGVAVIGSLSLIGGLAAACFTRAVGIVFLGEPRTASTAEALEVGRLMRLAMISLAACCVAIGLAGPLVVQIVAPVALELGRLPISTNESLITWPVGILTYITIGSLMLLALIAVIALIRRTLLSSREVGAAGTWDCGYTAGNTRMQYTASSYAQTLTTVFGVTLRGTTEFKPPDGFFPEKTEFGSHYPDVFIAKFFGPIFDTIGKVMMKLRWLQQGRIQLYILYIALTLLALLFWKLS
jgi:hydrogenase-4 component B